MAEGGLCVVTHPLGAAGENATRTLLDILTELCPVSLVTANLPADSTINDDHEVVELTSKGSGNSISTAAGRFLINQIRMCAVIGRRPEETILFFGATAYLLPILFASLTGKTVVVEPRGDVPLTLRLNWERRIPHILAKFLAGMVRGAERVGFLIADAVVTYTPGMATSLGLNTESAKVYPHGARYVDTERFEPTVPFDDREAVVGFVGRLDEEKGIRDLAKIAKRLPDDITFRFVGDGPLSEWLESELSSEISAGSVELTGWVDHDIVAEELNRMKLLVMPSQPTEGLPTTILEAMSCGTPVYASPVSGVPDVVSTDETGLLMDPDDLSTIVNQTERILQDDSLLQMSDNCRELIRQTYTFHAAVERYGGILAQVAEE